MRGRVVTLLAYDMLTVYRQQRFVHGVTARILLALPGDSRRDKLLHDLPTMCSTS